MHHLVPHPDDVLPGDLGAGGLPDYLDEMGRSWTVATAFTEGRVFRAINRAGRIWGDGLSPRVLWNVVRVRPTRHGPIRN